MIRAFLLFIIQAPLILAGVFIVPIMIPFRKTDESTRAPYTQYPELGEYVFTNYPGWWGNPCDGLIGDKRGEFAKWCVDHGIKPGGFLAMYIWTAVRNPINTWSRLVVGVDVSLCKIAKLWGDDVVQEKPGIYGVQYLIATREDGKKFPRFYAVLPWFFRPDKAIMIDIGWKIKLSHNNTPPDARINDRMKGDVLTISPWKGL